MSLTDISNARRPEILTIAKRLRREHPKWGEARVLTAAKAEATSPKRTPSHNKEKSL